MVIRDCVPKRRRDRVKERRMMRKRYRKIFKNSTFWRLSKDEAW